MKWTIGVLLLAGVGAAVCAAVLMASLRATDAEGDPEGEAAPGVEILVAARALPAMSVVDATAVLVKSVPEHEVPLTALSNSVQVVGKVLTAPMVKDQPFSRAYFATEGSGVHLASGLSDGKRAVSVALSDYASLDGVLYPGSVVDVLATIRLSSNGMASNVVSTTLLEAVQVLAIEQQTIFSDDEVSGEVSRIRANQRRMITLLVDSEQAKALQLASLHGTISLALRNPLDSTPSSTSMMTLRELVAPDRKGVPGPIPGAGFAKLIGRIVRSAVETGTRAAHASEKPGAPEPVAAKPAAPAPPAVWETVVIRGTSVENVSFTLRQDGRWAPSADTRPAATLARYDGGAGQLKAAAARSVRTATQ